MRRRSGSRLLVLLSVLLASGATRAAAAPPTISNISDVTTAEDVATASIAFTVSDPDTNPNALIVSASSNNQAVVPDAGITLGGTANARTIRVQPAPNAVGSATISVTVQDGSPGGAATDTFVVTVTAVNDAPTIASVAPVTTPEDIPVDVALTLGDVDTPPNALSLAGSSGSPALIPQAGITFSGTGGSRTMRVTPAANQSGSAVVTVTVSDGAGGQSSSPITINVTAVNDPPVISDIPDITIPEDTSTGERAFTVSDVDSAALQVSASSSNPALVPAANVILRGSGAARTIEVVPVASGNGTTTITVSVSDGANSTADTFVVTVAAVNDAPTMTALVNQQVQEDQTSTQPFTVQDPDTPLTALTVSAVSSNTALVPAANVSFGGSGGNRSVAVTPAANATGASTITITVSDGALTDSRSFLLTVNAVNDAPSVAPIANQTFSEDTSSAVLALAVSDPDNDPASLTVQVTSSNTALIPPQGLVLGGTGGSRTLRLTPAADASGQSTITVNVSDGTAGTSLQFVATVTPVNDQPTISPIPNQQTAEGTPTAPTAFTIGDPDNPPATPAAGLTLSATSSNPGVVPLANIVFGGAGAARTVTVTPAVNSPGSSTVTITVSDGQLTASSAFTLSVNAVNDAPTISDIPNQSVGEDRSVGPLSFTVNDVDSPTLTVTATSGDTTLVPQGNIVLGGTGSNRTISVTPAANRSGAATITVSVSDGSATTSDQFVLTVNVVNDAPTITAIPPQTFNEDTASALLSFTVDDVDNDPTTLQVTAQSSNMGLVPVANVELGGTGRNRTVRVIPAANGSGQSMITLRVADAANAAATTAFLVTVNPVNDPPAISNIPNQSTNEDIATAAIGFTVGDIDNSSATLTVAASSSNQTLIRDISLDGSGGSRTIRLTPAPDTSGQATITVTVTDPLGASSSDTFVLTVNSLNDLPTISTISTQTIPEDTQTNTLWVSVSDTETAALALVLSATSSNQSLVPQDATHLLFGGTEGTRALTVFPAANQIGSSTITVTVTDAEQGTASTSFVLTVTPVNDAPTITAFAPVTIAEDTSSSPIAFIIGDAETPAGQLLVTAAASSTALVPSGSIVLAGAGANRTLTITPAPNASGATTLTVSVSDGVAVGSAVLTLTVDAGADPPTMSAIGDQQTPEDTPTLPIPLIVSDPDNPPANPAQGLSLSATSSNPAVLPAGAVVFGGTGTNRTVTLVPEFGQSGTALVGVTVTDATGLSAHQQFALTVSSVPCSYTVTPLSSLALGEAGGSVVLAVATRQGCAWTTSLSGSPSWLTVVAPTSAVFGEGGVSLSAAPNTSVSPRSATVLVGNQQVTITQGGAACTYSAQADPASFEAVGGAGTLSITTQPGCPWAISGASAWLNFGPASLNGNGPAQLGFAVAANIETQIRSLQLMVAGQPVSVLQTLASTTADSDGDGLPDLWELQFGLAPDSTSSDDGPAGDPDHDGVTNLEEFRNRTHPRGFVSRLLAEGATSSFFETLLALANPDTVSTARVLLRFLKPDGTFATQFVAVPPLSRRTVVAGAVADLGATAFSTDVESDISVVVDRTMSWDASGYGAHSESSIDSPKRTWYFAEGATHSGFDLFYLLENPSLTAAATVLVTYLRPAPLPPLEKTYELGPGSRTNIWVNFEEFPQAGSGDFALASVDVSAVIQVTQGPPIAAERAMYLSRAGQLFAAGHDSAGIAEPATDWFLAEGATGAFFDEFVLIANPNPADAQVHATFLKPDGSSVERDFAVPADSRFNIWLDTLEIPEGSGERPLSDTAVSTLISSTNGVPVIVERAMWWPGDVTTWGEANNAPGTTATGTRWATAEGEVGGPRQGSTYVLLANPTAVEARVRVTLLFESGTAERTFVLRPQSRFNVDVGFEFAPYFATAVQSPIRFGAVVESLGDGNASATPIVVERAMYWNANGGFWAAGANALATKLQ